MNPTASEEPEFDPAHLAAVLIVTMVVMGCLFWLLWTLLVFEGGIFLKIKCALAVLFTSKTLADFGYQGTPYAMGAFEGWLGNSIALAMSLIVIAALYRLYQDAARRQR